MIPASFEYVAASSVEDALRLLREHGDAAKVLAGGHSLIPLMKLRLSEPGLLIDLGPVEQLRGIRLDGARVSIGAMTTYAAIGAARNLAGLDALREAALAVGDVQVRNRGTIGGSLAHADPGADLPAAILALEAELVLQGEGGERMVAAAGFFQGLFTTEMGEDELLTEVRFALPPGRSGSAYQKFANPASGYAIVGVAASVTLAEDGIIQEARVGVTGAGDHAVRAEATEAALRGKRPDENAIKEAASQAAGGIDPLDDLHASAAYRAELTRVFAARALRLAVERAGQ